MKRLRNTSGLPDSTVEAVVNWIASELGITGFDVECRKCGGKLAGMAYYRGSHFHTTKRPFVVLRVGKAFPAKIKPYQYKQHKGKSYVVASRTEALVYIAAHELRHLWQFASHSDKRKSAKLPRYHGSRGKFSEVDTEAFAIHTLRAYRKRADLPC